ncbi:potassium channel family protein [Streptococcus caballi]|uniref:potassium channel family protein n=1 Tax=Streptococcus caballi TaxID=439220 RepID=UPI000375F2AC|nr:TrkA family potassium uptake protein [Streptococcus caballi]
MERKIIGVLGLGVFGKTVAMELSKFEQDVIVIDSDQDNVQDVSDFVSKAAIGDFTDLEFLKHMGIADCDSVVIATGNSLESSVLAVMHCKKLGVSTVIAKAKSTIYEEVLYEIGADFVISPERESGRQVASSLLRHKIADIIKLESDISIVEFKVPTSWVGKTVVELDVRKKYDLNIIGTRQTKTAPLQTDIGLKEPIKADTIIVAITNTDTFEKYDYLGYFDD